MNDLFSETPCPDETPPCPAEIEEHKLPNELKIASLNVCGLKTRINYPDFIILLEKYDIVCIQESKLDIFDIIDVPEFTFFSKPRKEKYLRKSGGLAYFIKNTIVDQRLLSH